MQQYLDLHYTVLRDLSQLMKEAGRRASELLNKIDEVAGADTEIPINLQQMRLSKKVYLIYYFHAMFIHFKFMLNFETNKLLEMSHQLKHLKNAYPVWTFSCKLYLSTLLLNHFQYFHWYLLKLILIRTDYSWYQNFSRFWIWRYRRYISVKLSLNQLLINIFYLYFIVII